MLKIDYKLVGTGWSECYVSAGKKKILITSSYIGFPIEDFAQAVIDLSQGEKITRVNFEEEPGQFRWIFKRKGENVDIEIREFDDCWSKEKDSVGKLIFSYTCSVREVIDAIVRCLENVYKKYGLTKYRKLWCSDFPIHQYRKIKKLSKV